eukprot:6125342-Prymnesium_polylepis.1
MKVPPFSVIVFEAQQSLINEIQSEHFGVPFGLFLRYDMKMTLTKILAMTQAASKAYDATTDRYRSKILRYHPVRKDVFICVPRLAPPESKLMPEIRKLEAELGVMAEEDGKIATLSFEDQERDMLQKDTGTHGMPPLSEYLVRLGGT